jgi:hypothetical protein
MIVTIGSNIMRLDELVQRLAKILDERGALVAVMRDEQGFCLNVIDVKESVETGEAMLLTEEPRMIDEDEPIDEAEG